MELMQQLQTEVSEQRDYSFKTDHFTFSIIGTKGEEQSFVTGYISVPEIDLYNELVTPNALKSMLRQIMEKTITLDYEHEAWRDDNTILPVGKITEAKVDDKGLWVKAELNPHSPKYKALWGSIKGGFVNAFSIAFKPLKVVAKTIGDTTIKLIEDLELLNVALTATPVNSGAIMTGHNIKAVLLKAIEDTKEEKVLVSKALITKLMEEKSMGEETETVTPEAEVTEEVAPVEEATETPTEEAPEATPEPETKDEEVKEEVVEEEKPVEEGEAELKAIVKELSSKVEAQAKELKAIKETPVFKSIVSDNKPALKSEKVDMLNLI